MSTSTGPATSTAHTLESFNLLSLHPYTHTNTRCDVPPFCITHDLAPRLRIVSLGDSLTQQASFPDGWFTLLGSRYVRRADLFNRGYAGYTTSNAVTTLRHHLRAGIWPFVPSASPELSSTTAASAASSAASPAYSQLVTLCLGANDAALPSEDGSLSLHVPLDTYTANLRRIIELLVPEYAQLSTAPAKYLSPTTALILLTPPQLDEPTWRAYLAKRDGTPQVKGRDNDVTGQYAAAVKAIAAEWHIPVVDLHSLTASTAAGTWPYFSDGLHFNAVGNASVFKAIVECVDRHYPQLSVERLGMDAPPFEGWAHDGSAEQKWPSGQSEGDGEASAKRMKLDAGAEGR